jgi:hypothetical protein
MTVTEKNTKTEILKAYEALLNNVQQEKANVPKQVQEDKQRNETLEKVSGISSNNIEKSITELKSSLSNSLDELSRNLISEFKKLEEIRSAIAIEKKNLEDMYSLSATTDSLAAMILAQKVQKEQFQEEMSDKTAQWELEKSRQKIEEKEYNDELTKRRKREEEEFQYALKITRKKDKDEYEASKAALEYEIKTKKAEFEQDVASREKALKEAESELAELRKNNEAFPVKLEKAVSDKETEITKTLKAQYGFDIKFLEKQNEAEIRLKDQMITSMQEKISELQTQIKEYSEKANRAEAGVKDIAFKAIESAAKAKTIERIETSSKE